MPAPLSFAMPARRIALAGAVTALLLAGCGGSQHPGGMQMPPAQVTTEVMTPQTIPVSYEYVGQTTGS